MKIENTKENRTRPPFWLGLIVGSFIGAAALFLIGMMLWDPPF